jgi:hypothetical protein
MSTLPDGWTISYEDVAIKEVEGLINHSASGACSTPVDENAARGRALISFLMEDRLFLALYRSNDPGVRATAIDLLKKAHLQAYGSTAVEGDTLIEQADPRAWLHDMI